MSMKTWSALLLTILLVAPATAQVASWNDAVGDQTITYSLTSDGSTAYEVPNDAGWYPTLDITRVGVYEETEDYIVFEVVLADDRNTGTEPDDLAVANYQVHFTYHDEPMRINLRWYQDFGEPYGWVERLEGEQWQYLTWAYTEDHPDEPGMVIYVQKWELRDKDLIPARQGDTLSNIWATAGRDQYDWYGGIIPAPAGLNIVGTGIRGAMCTSPSDLQGDETEGDALDSGCGFRPRDYAGDSGSPLGEYTLTIAPEGLGHLLLEVERPVRASNGLATTYVYELRLFNFDDEADSVNLAAVDVPSGWDVYLPPRVDIEPDEVKNIRMAIGVPFGHKHGEWAGLSIQAKSQRDPTATSETTVGVYWPLIAQPSGHHPRIYFHADGFWRWMNTVQEDPDAASEGIVPAFKGRYYLYGEDDDMAIQRVTYSWYNYLRPGLFTGLDFETGKPIEGNLAVALDQTLNDATITTQLMLYLRGEDDLLLGEQVQQASFVAGQSQDIAISMPVNELADRLPYEQDSGLYFTMDIEGILDDPNDVDDSTVAGLFGYNYLADMEYQGEMYSATSYLDLPLLDYHDDVDPGLLDALTRLQLEAPEEVVRPANPGKTLAFYFEILNKGDEDDTVEWHIEGPKADWADVVPDSTDVDGLDRATVAIRVDVPADEPQDSVADLLLVGQSVNNPDAQVFGRFQAYVETEADIPDEADRFLELMDTANETESQGAPFPSVAALAAVAAAGLLRRRKA